MNTPADSRRAITAFAAVAALVAAFTALGYSGIPFAPVGVDDANTFFVYGRNLAEGHGLGWNPGGERVEGFSSILWMLIVAAITRSGLPLESSLRITSVILVSAALTPWIFLASRLIARTSERSWHGASLLLAWTLATPAYVVWCCLSLMETALWSAVLLWTAALLVWDCRRPQPGSRLWLAAGVSAMLLTRPEGMAWGLVFIALFAAVRWTHGARRAALARAVAPSVLAYALVAGGLTVFRLMYFGWPLPNSYYAKVSPSLAYNLGTGLRYFLGFLNSNWILWPATLAALAGLVVAVRGIRRAADGELRFERLALGVISALVLAACAMPVLMGGDHMALHRFYRALWPLYLLPGLILGKHALIAVERIRLQPGAWSRLVLASIVAALFFVAPSVRWDELPENEINRGFELAYIGRQMGLYLNLSFADMPAPAVGVIAAGGFAYGYEGRTIDLMGINSVAMAHTFGDRRGMRGHAAFDKIVFYQLKPELLLPHAIQNPADARRYLQKPWYYSVLKGLPRDELFQARYVMAAIRPREQAAEIYLAAFFNRDFLDRLANAGDYQIFQVEDDDDDAAI